MDKNHSLLVDLEFFHNAIESQFILFLRGFRFVLDRNADEALR